MRGHGGCLQPSSPKPDRTDVAASRLGLLGAIWRWLLRILGRTKLPLDDQSTADAADSMFSPLQLFVHSAEGKRPAEAEGRLVEAAPDSGRQDLGPTETTFVPSGKHSPVGVLEAIPELVQQTPASNEEDRSTVAEHREREEVCQAARAESMLGPTRPQIESDPETLIIPAMAAATNDHRQPSSGDAAEEIPGGMPSASEATVSDPSSISPSIERDAPAAQRPTHVPPKYRPRLDGRSRTAPRPLKAGVAAASATAAPLDAELALTFRAAGWGIELSLLLHRGPGMGEQVAVRVEGQVHDLWAIDDQLFEPAQIGDALSLLESGAVAESIGAPSVRWQRSGRDLHIFVPRAGIAGFVSTSRVVIGNENAVLCRSELAESVLRVSQTVGAREPEEVIGPGIAAGWRCFRAIYPSSAIAPADCDSVLLALVPLPDSRIELDGGISMGRSSWLVGYPPAIRIAGAIPRPGDVSIDDVSASADEAGRWSALGWDSIGQHTIWYSGLSRNYSIDPAPSSWERWDSHAGNGLSICGALATGQSGRLAFPSADEAVWLLGRIPGEVASTVLSGSGAIFVAAPAFQPVWIVAALSGRKRSAQFPRLVGPPAAPLSPKRPIQKDAIRLWCQVIRSVSRARRNQSSEEARTIALWSLYRQAARALWRRSR